MACYFGRMNNIWTQSNGGETTTFYSCGLCGASVQRQDREKHEEWHVLLNEVFMVVNVTMPVMER
jgi:hypothetical protein